MDLETRAANNQPLPGAATRNDFATLPREIVMEIMCELPPESFNELKGTSKYMNQVGKDGLEMYKKRVNFAKEYHHMSPFKVAFHGNKVAIADRTARTITVYDFVKDQKLHEWASATKDESGDDGYWIRNMDFNHDGTLLATGSREELMRVFDMNGKIVHEHKCNNWVELTRFDPVEVTKLWFADYMGNIFLLDTFSGMVINHMKVDSSINNWLFLNDDWVVVTTHNKTLFLKKKISGIYAQFDNGNSTYGIAVVNDTIMTGSHDNRIKTYKKQNNQWELINTVEHSDWVTGLAYNGKYLYVTCMKDSDIRIWDLKANKFVDKKFKTKEKHVVDGFNFDTSLKLEFYRGYLFQSLGDRVVQRFIG